MITACECWVFEHMQVIHSRHLNIFDTFDGCEKLHLVVVTFSLSSLTCGLVALSFCTLSTPPHLLPAPHLQLRVAPSFPPSLPPFISHCSLQPIWPRAAQPRAAFEEPIRWRLTSPLFACLGSAHGTVKRKTRSLRGEIFAKLLYLFVFSSWFPFEAFSNLEWMMSFRFD